MLRSGLLGFGLLVLVSSCRSTKITTEGIDPNLSSKAAIKANLEKEPRFRTMAARLKIDYQDGETSQGVTVSLRVRKGEAIWISAPLGMVKAYITPDRVSFYNKLEKEYFDGDFSYLSRILGISLDYDKVENLLLGRAIFNLRDEKYDLEVVGGAYRLRPRNPLEALKVMFTLDPRGFDLKAQQLSQPFQKRLLDIRYKDFGNVGGRALPKTIDIVANKGLEQSKISMEYRNIELDTDLGFPYSIPDGYKEIVLKQDDI